MENCRLQNGGNLSVDGSPVVLKKLVGRSRSFVVIECLGLSFFLLGVLFLLAGCQEEKRVVWPNDVEKLLQDLGDNRLKFEGVLKTYSNDADSLKFKAACFLLDNIKVHQSKDSYWLDSSGGASDFSELQYDSFSASLTAFDSLKMAGRITGAQSFAYYDVDTLSANYLMTSIDQAFEVRKYPWVKDLTFELFCQYVLPYRVSNEPVQQWRKAYFHNNKWVFSRLVNEGANYEVCRLINDSIANSFFNTFKVDKRQEPLPLLGPLNLQHRLQGDCSDLVNYTVYCLRSIGVPAAVDFVPHWGTSSGRHFWNVTFDQEGRPNYFMGGGEPPGEYVIYRELPKVYRITYQKQAGCIGAKIAADSIPDKLLQMPNLMDVTSRYVKTVDLSLALGKRQANEAVFLCVLNNLKWQPVCGNVAGSDGRVMFKEVGCGIIYLPMVYRNKKFVAVGAPCVVDHEGRIQRRSANKSVRTEIRMEQEPGFLVFRPGKNYKLYYWDNRWRLVQQKEYQTGESLLFSAVPQNAVMLMVPEYSWGKERPFTMKNGERIWW